MDHMMETHTQYSILYPVCSDIAPLCISVPNNKYSSIFRTYLIDGQKWFSYFDAFAVTFGASHQDRFISEDYDDSLLFLLEYFDVSKDWEAIWQDDETNPRHTVLIDEDGLIFMLAFWGMVGWNASAEHQRRLDLIGNALWRPKMKRIEMKYNTEREIEDAFCAYLDAQSINYIRQPTGGELGRPDVVTDDTLYEFKHTLNKREIARAAAQITAYRIMYPSISRLVIVGGYAKGDIDALRKIAHKLGVELVMIDDIIK